MQIYLKHLLNVVIFRLEQLAPGGQVTVGQDPAGFQQPVSVTLKSRTHNIKSIGIWPKEDTISAVCATNDE